MQPQATPQAYRGPAVTLAALCTLALALGGCAGAATNGRAGQPSPAARGTVSGAPAASAAHGGGAGSAVARTPTRARTIGVRVLHLIDRSRHVVLRGGRVLARALTTYVRYPAAPGGPFPLIVFGHGFAVTPAPYARLLDAWARAGFVVAAPVFPLGNANAPGGPDESDLHNQPADMSFVVSALVRASRAGGQLPGLINPRQIALAGQSDGGDTALAAAYDPRFRDPRIDAAVILSGAEIPGLGTFAFPRRGPALLATQGTADTINLPSETELFFTAAPGPKYLLRIFGAGHLGPYTTPGLQLAVVERVTIAFLRRYLERDAAVRLASGPKGAGAVLLGEG